MAKHWSQMGPTRCTATWINHTVSLRLESSGTWRSFPAFEEQMWKRASNIHQEWLGPGTRVKPVSSNREIEKERGRDCLATAPKTLNHIFGSS